MAKFANHKIRNAVLNERKHLKGTNIFIREDFSDKVLAKRRELVPKMFEARRNGMVAYLRYDFYLFKTLLCSLNRDFQH